MLVWQTQSLGDKEHFPKIAFVCSPCVSTCLALNVCSFWPRWLELRNLTENTGMDGWKIDGWVIEWMDGLVDGWVAISITWDPSGQRTWPAWVSDQEELQWPPSLSLPLLPLCCQSRPPALADFRALSSKSEQCHDKNKIIRTENIFVPTSSASTTSSPWIWPASLSASSLANLWMARRCS